MGMRMEMGMMIHFQRRLVGAGLVRGQYRWVGWSVGGREEYLPGCSRSFVSRLFASSRFPLSFWFSPPYELRVYGRRAVKRWAVRRTGRTDAWGERARRMEFISS